MKISSTLKTTLVAVGGSIVAAPSAALELGDIKVHSTIGEPLRASIAYALGPNEALAETCVSVPRSKNASGLPSTNGVSLTVANGVIAITGRSAVQEPLMTVRLNVSCPYTAQLTREYMMFIDPPSVVDTAPIEAPLATRAAARPQLAAATATATRAPVAARRAVNTAPVEAASNYQVQPGDSLSEIAQRVKNRPAGVWKTVNTIFAMNPGAFVDNDPNKLRAGSWLTIPSFAADTQAAVTTPTAAPVDTDSGTLESANETQPANAIESPVTADLKAGDVIVIDGNPLIAPADSVSTETVVIPDTAIAGPKTSSASPNVPVATIQSSSPSTPSNTQWLLWLGGAGIAIILGLLLFGRRSRDDHDSRPITPDVPQRRQTDDDTQNTEAVSEFEMELDDDSPTSENLSLDADLVIGSGLNDGIEVDAAQDLGFAAATALDMEFPEDTAQTAIDSPAEIDGNSTFENEIFAGEEDEYEMSVIVDATKVPLHDDVVTQDLDALKIDVDDEALITDDYRILEQDYEEELTATQALNAELQKAVSDLAKHQEEEANDDTARLPLATVHELGLPASDEDGSDTAVNPTIEVNTADETVEMRNGDTVEMPKDGKSSG